jgi:hypothetical protein
VSTFQRPNCEDNCEKQLLRRSRHGRRWDMCKVPQVPGPRGQATAPSAATCEDRIRKVVKRHFLPPSCWWRGGAVVRWCGGAVVTMSFRDYIQQSMKKG